MRYVPKPIRNCELYEEKDWVLRPPSLTDIKIRLIEELPRYEQKIPLDSIVKGNPLLLHTEITRSYASCPILDVFFIQAMQESLLCVLFLVNGAVTLKAPRGTWEVPEFVGLLHSTNQANPKSLQLEGVAVDMGETSLLHLPSTENPLEDMLRLPPIMDFFDQIGSGRLGQCVTHSSMVTSPAKGNVKLSKHGFLEANQEVIFPVAENLVTLSQNDRFPCCFGY